MDNWRQAWAFLRDLLRVLQARYRLHRNREAITHYNRRVAEYGLLADDAEPL